MHRQERVQYRDTLSTFPHVFRFSCKHPGMWSLLFVTLILSLMPCGALVPESKSETEEGCGEIFEKIVLEDRHTMVDDTPSRLHSTWLSEACEVRAGPTYLIRKYKFFENGTFLLIRHHYAEESCSLATHTVVARGIIDVLSPSIFIPGATEAKAELSTVQLIPLNRQVAHKFERKANASCGPEPKWRPYTARAIYERPIAPTSQSFPRWYRAYNSPQNYPSLWKDRTDATVDCSESFGIEFTELGLLRVQKKRDSFGRRVELLLGNAPRRPAHLRGTRGGRPTSLQSTALLRVDAASGCPICGSVLRGTEYSPPLLHEAAALPAFIGGLWLSTRCESIEGGVWARRLFRIYSDDKLWSATWDYYSDSKCSNFLYAISAAGTYVQRATRQRRHGQFLRDLQGSHLHVLERYPYSEESSEVIGSTFSATNDPDDSHSEGQKERAEKNVERNVYRHIFRNNDGPIVRSFAAILRGRNREFERPSERDLARPGKAAQAKTTTPSGTTELELQVAESRLIPADKRLLARCGINGTNVRALVSWPRGCVPHAVEAPSTLRLRARLALNWNGQYTLLLGSRDDAVWDAPLRRCSSTPSRNSPLRAHLGRTLALRYGLFFSAGESSSNALRPISLGVPSLFLLSLFGISWTFVIGLGRN